VFPGGSSPRPPFSRFARCAVTGWAVEERFKEGFLQTGWACGGRSEGDSAPSEARKRGSGGGSPRKHDNWFSQGILLVGPTKRVQEKDLTKVVINELEFIKLLAYEGSSKVGVWPAPKESSISVPTSIPSLNLAPRKLLKLDFTYVLRSPTNANDYERIKPLNSIY